MSTHDPADDASTPTSDAALLHAHADGDRDAFATLVARHRDRLWAVALRTAGDPEEAADALQDALVAAYRRAGTFRGEAAVTTWLHRIVVNACLDRLRRSRVRRSEPLPDDPAESLATAARLSGWTPPADDPERRLLDHDLRDRLRDALLQLPEEQRLCLVLVDLEQWSVAEVADHLGVPVGTVKSRCHRGRSRLAGLLTDLRPVARPTPGTAPGPAPGTTSTPDASHPVETGRPTSRTATDDLQTPANERGGPA